MLRKSKKTVQRLVSFPPGEKESDVSRERVPLTGSGPLGSKPTLKISPVVWGWD